MLAMDDLLTHRRLAFRQAARDGHNNLTDEKINATNPAWCMDLTPLRWNITPEEGQRRRAMGLSHKHWRFASTVAHHTGTGEFVDALTVSVREEAETNSSRQFCQRRPCRRISNPRHRAPRSRSVVRGDDPESPLSHRDCGGGSQE
jgi:hypothetical protein